MSGVDLDGRQIRKGAADAMKIHRVRIPRGGASIGGDHLPFRRHPLVVAEKKRVLGVIHLKDIVKGGLKTVLSDSGPWESRP